MSLKVDNFLRPFRGRADYNFHTFGEKVIVLFGIQKWDDNEKKMAHFPLFLEGNAFLMCWKLSTEDKKRCD